jgi:hypothetical protein
VLVDPAGGLAVGGDQADPLLPRAPGGVIGGRRAEGVEGPAGSVGDEPLTQDAAAIVDAGVEVFQVAGGQLGDVGRHDVRSMRCPQAAGVGDAVRDHLSDE